MTLEERGAYITLLAWSWERGPVPNDMKRMAVIIGADLDTARRVLDEVLKRWYLDDAGRWLNRRLELVREEQRKFSESQAEKGKRGAERRWRAPSIAGANAPAIATAIAQPITQAQPNVSPDDGSPISDLQSPDPPRKEREGDTRAREDSPPPLLNGASQRMHGVHAWCSLWVGRDGLCVPLGLHGQFIGRLGGSDADTRLKAWYAATVTALDGRPIGDRLFDFWENQFAAWVGTVTAKPQMVGKGARTVSAFDRAAPAVARRS